MLARHDNGTNYPGRLAGVRKGAVPLAVLLILAPCLLVSAGPIQATEISAAPDPFEAADGSGQALSLQGQDEPLPPNPLLYLDIWLFGGLVLLVALIVGIKYLWKALQPDDRDPSEGLQPWERPDDDDKGP